MSDPATHEADCVCAECLTNPLRMALRHELASLDAERQFEQHRDRVIKRVMTDGISTKDGMA